MTTLTAPTPTDKKIIPGGSFLISDATPSDCFFPEDFTEEHRQIAQTTSEFALNEIVPVSDQIEAKDFAVTRRLIKEASEPYSQATSPALHAKRMVQWLGDKQPTSAVKCAELVWQLGHCSYPPLRLLLGSYAIESIRDRLRSIIEELEDWKHLHFPVAPDANLNEDKDEDNEDGRMDTTS